MKKSIVTVVLVFAVAALVFAQAPTTAPQTGAPGQTQAGAAQQPGQPAQQQRKEIKDPAEYQMFMAAFQQQDPAAKVQALNDYLTRYPNTVMKKETLESMLGAQQQVVQHLQQQYMAQPQNQQALANLRAAASKQADIAYQLVQVDPKNVLALTLLAVNYRTEGEQAMAQTPNNPNNPDAAKNFGESFQYSQQALQALDSYAPEGVSPQQLAQQKAQLATVLSATAGFDAAQMKDWPATIKYLGQALKDNPNDQDYRDYYFYGLALTEQKPPDPLGLFYLARAAAIAPQGPAAQSITRFAQGRYVKYHGDTDGWDQVLSAAKASSQPPANFTITPAPSPAEQAAKLVASKPVAQMSFDEFQMIFTSGNQQAIDQVWNAIKGKPISFVAKVQEASPTKLTLSATAEDIQANTPDVSVVMTEAIPAKYMPQVGSDATVTGTPTSFTATPFMITMSDGKLVVKQAPPAKKPTTPARRPTTKKKPS